MNSRNIVLVAVAFFALLLIVWASQRHPILSYHAKRVAAADAATFISGHLEDYEQTLRIGLSRSRAAAVLPKPNNTNTSNVWTWVRDYSPPAANPDWRKLILWPKNGYFLVLVDGKVATPLCVASEFDPWEALVKYSNKSQAEADQILGPK